MGNSEYFNCKGCKNCIVNESIYDLDLNNNSAHKKCNTLLSSKMYEDKDDFNYIKINDEFSITDNNENISNISPLKNVFNEIVKKAYNYSKLVLLIETIFRGFFYRKSFHKIKEKLKEEESITIQHYLAQFNAKYYSEIERLNPDINNDLRNYSNYNIDLFNKNNNNLFTKGYCKDDTFYIGEMDINNKKNGYGILYTNKGEKYEGFFENDCFTTYGRYTVIPENCTYEGNFINYKLNGEGKKYANDYLFMGLYKDNLPNGEGIEDNIYFKYVGEYKNGKKEGNGGIYYKNNKEYYNGEFKDDNINGYGKYKFNNKDEYEGMFLNGKMNGDGTYIWSNGVIYKGSYINNIKVGKGTYIFPTNEELYVVYDNNGNIISNGKININNEIIEISLQN